MDQARVGCAAITDKRQASPKELPEAGWGHFPARVCNVTAVLLHFVPMADRINHAGLIRSGGDLGHSGANGEGIQ